MRQTTPDYDAAGNTTFDGNNSYAYDGEGRVCAVATPPITAYTVATQYIYDAEGNRVAKGTANTILVGGSYVLSCDTTVNGFSVTHSYALGPGGEQLTEMAVSGGTMQWAHTNVYGPEGLLGTYDNAGLHFQFADWLGTKRVQTDYAGNSELTCQSLPFGDPTLPCTATPATEQFFTGKERDSESGNDYFDARYYASEFGRFISPDWSAQVAPVPYAVMDDPQSLNLYSYVQNGPLIRMDIDGHFGGISYDLSNLFNEYESEVQQQQQAQQQQQQAQEAQQAQQQGSGTAGTIYNETSTLREDRKTVGPNLHNARVAIAQVIDVNHSTAKVASPTVQDNLNYPPAGAAMKDSQAAVSEESTAPNGTQGATHFFLAGGNTPTPAWVSQGKVVESFGPFPVAANTHDFSKGQSATIQIIQYPVPKQ